MLPLAVAAERHPDIVERYLGTVVRQRSRLTVENDARWSDGAFVYVPRGVHVEAPIVLVDASTSRPAARCTIARSSCSRRARRPRSGTSRCRRTARPRASSTASPSSSSGRTRGCASSTRRRCPRRRWVFGAQRAIVERDGSLDWITLGFGSGNGKVFLETKLAGPGAHAARHRRVRHARPPAPGLRHAAGARGARHDVRPRVPRHPRRPLEHRLARHDPGRRGRAAHRRLPGVAQPAAQQEGPRRLDPGPRDPRQRRALHARRGDRPDRPRAALLPALPRPAARPTRTGSSSRASSRRSSSASRRARCATPSPPRSSAGSRCVLGS